MIGYYLTELSYNSLHIVLIRTFPLLLYHKEKGASIL